MAGSLLLLLDDIATVLDDVATMTKVAVKKTAGVLGDDLALNAKQVTGVRPARASARPGISWGAPPLRGATAVHASGDAGAMPAMAGPRAAYGVAPWRAIRAGARD